MTIRIEYGVGLALALALAPRPARAQAPVRSVTLEEAVKLAQQAQPVVAQALGGVRNAEAQMRAAKGEYLPNVNANTSGSRNWTQGQSRLNPVTNELQGGNTASTSLNLGLSASVDLFTGFRRGADHRAAKATEASADASYTNARFQAELTATQQFFDALAAQQLVAVRQTSVRRAEEQLNLSVAKLHVGSATRSDSLRSLVNLGNAQLALVSAQSDVAGKQALLGRTLGLDGQVAAQDDSAFYHVVTSLDTTELMREALARSPQVRAADANVDAASAAVKAAKSAYWPTLALSGQTNWSGSSGGNYQLFNQRQVSLGLTWPLFNRFQREQNIENRAVAQDVAQATADDTRRGVQASLTTQFAALDAARVQIDITKTSVAAAEEDLRVVNERYRVGAATILDVLTSQEALAQAEVDVVNARFGYLKAKAQIEALIGRHL
ncbi:MAG TPA: TolC family protein [Gemmatimonadales bacterium]|nr:TolC family protein [Gemmatimonadales bacterium]